MKKKLLFLIPYLLIISYIFSFAFEAFGRRDMDYGLAVSCAVFFFSLSASIVWKSLGNKDLDPRDKKPKKLRNALFHFVFASLSLLLVASAFMVHKKIKNKIGSEECRIYMCSALVDYDKQYPMHKEPIDLFRIKNKSPYTEHINDEVYPNLGSERDFLVRMRNKFYSFPNGCSSDFYHLNYLMDSTVSKKESWLSHLIEMEEDGYFPRRDEGNPSMHDISEGYNQIKEYRDNLDCE